MPRQHKTPKKKSPQERLGEEREDRCDDIIATKIPIIADRPESALHKFGTAPGVLIKAPPVDRRLLNPLITGAAGWVVVHLQPLNDPGVQL